MRPRPERRRALRPLVGAGRLVAAAVAVLAAIAVARSPAGGAARPADSTPAVRAVAAPAAGAADSARTLRPTPPASEPLGAAPPRALWVVRNTLNSSADTRAMIGDCARIGCSLIFLQVSGRWDAYFPSAVFPAGQFWDAAEGDNLALALELAHARGIRVHAWVNALLGWSAAEPPRDPAHVFHRHRDWFLTDVEGRSITRLSRRELDRRRLDGYFLEPRVPEVRTALRRFVLELVTRYDLDGVHLDYIRWPSPQWGFQPELRERYREEAGVDPRELYANGAELARERGAEWLVAARAAWQAWHREGVTQLVRLVAEDVRAVRPGLELSAAVLANPVSARDDFGQDWAAWLREGSLDVAAPMVYRPSAAQVLELLQTAARHLPEDARLFAGVSLEFLRAAEVKPVEALMGRYGADGVAIFSYNLLREDPRALAALAVR